MGYQKLGHASMLAVPLLADFSRRSARSDEKSRAINGKQDAVGNCDTQNLLQGKTGGFAPGL